MVTLLTMNLPIRINLATRSALAAGATLAVVFGGLAASESASARRRALADLLADGRALASIHSPNLVEAITSADDVVVLRSLEALTALPFVVSAAVVDARGREFARGALHDNPGAGDATLIAPLSRGAVRSGALRLNLSGRTAGAAAADAVQRAWARAGLAWAVGTGLVWLAVRPLARRLDNTHRENEESRTREADALAGAAGARALAAAIPGAVPVPMLVTDHNHRVVAASAAFRSRWLAGSDATGRHVSDVLPRGPLSDAARDCARVPGTIVRRRLEPAGDLTALAVKEETGRGIAGMVLVINAQAPATAWDASPATEGGVT